MNIIKEVGTFAVNGQIRRMLFQTTLAPGETEQQARERLKKIIEAMRKKKQAC